MQRATLGRTGLEVTRLGFGAMEIRGPRIWNGRPVTDREADRILNAVLDSGINFIDTAYDYGLSEAYIGQYISHRRSEFYIATKCGCTLVDRGDHDDTPHTWTRENLLRNIDESLKRMKTDYVDILQLHNPSVEDVQSGSLVEVLQEIQRAGKTRWIGISTTFPHLTEFAHWGVFDTFQIPYSGLERAHENALDLVADSGAGVIVRGGVGRGEPGVGLGDEQRWKTWEAARLDELLEPGESRTAFVLRMTLSHRSVDTIIAGTKVPEHLAENLVAAERGPLAEDTYQEALRRLAEAGEKPL
jgi:aryl-alcohol dehydrogenase-like predicted oxidoreductase